MTHISILVPDNTVLENSVGRLLKIFDLAHHLAREAGSRSAFELHLVGNARTVALYGGQFVVEPDLTLAEVAGTDLVIVPAMAGNIAEAVGNNSAFLPWIQKQFRAGAEMVGLCTGVFFLADAGLIHEEDCCWRWFVDPEFRTQYTQINCLAHRAAVAAKSVHTEGAWAFFEKWLQRVMGNGIAEACSAAFRDPFNAECQSVVSACDPRRLPADGPLRTNQSRVREPVPEFTLDRLTVLSEVSQGRRERSGILAAGLAEGFQSPLGTIPPNACCTSPREDAQWGANNHNPRAMKALFKRLERIETSYPDGQASRQNDR